jgi:hypothetical protein
MTVPAERGGVEPRAHALQRDDGRDLAAVRAGDEREHRSRLAAADDADRDLRARVDAGRDGERAGRGLARPHRERPDAEGRLVGRAPRRAGLRAGLRAERRGGERRENEQPGGEARMRGERRPDPARHGR